MSEITVEVRLADIEQIKAILNKLADIVCLTNEDGLDCKDDIRSCCGELVCNDGGKPFFTVDDCIKAAKMVGRQPEYELLKELHWVEHG